MIQPTGSSLNFSGVSISSGTDIGISNSYMPLLALLNQHPLPAFIPSALKNGVPATLPTPLLMPA
jgi:hypothetical protein